VVLVGNRRRPAQEIRAPDASQTTTPWRQLANVIAMTTPGRALALAAVPGGILLGLGSLAVALELDANVLRVNEEYSAATYFSTLLLFAGGAVAFYLWRQGGLYWGVLGLCFTYLGLDEASDFHERFEVRFDIPAALALAPGAIVGAIATIPALPRLRAHPPALPLFVAGVASWVVAIAIDPWHARWKSVIEEFLEMTGSTLILLGLLVVVTAGRTRE
jgi:hypothetical protein